MRIQTRALTSPSSSTGTSNCEFIIGRIGEVAAGIEIAAGGAADIAAGAELARQFGLKMPVATVRSCSEAVLS